MPDFCSAFLFVSLGEICQRTMKTALVLSCLFFSLPALSQVQLKGVVADSISRQVLPFATVQTSNKKAVVADINGSFNIAISDATAYLLVSYSGHQTKKIAVEEFHTGDTILLSPKMNDLSEIIVRPQQNKINRIVNAAVANKQKNNPEFYEAYQCNVYYKMHVDVTGIPRDTFNFFTGNKYLLLTETFSKRMCKRPQQLQETVLASRFSGLQKTYFTNLVTDVLPFHVYSNYITLNNKEYINPISAGWQQRYQFSLHDELTIDADTVFVLSFSPKSLFNSLSGVVYINSNGYAISHIVAENADTTNGRRVHFEQIYSFTKGRWFPQELNYDLTIKRFMSPSTTVILNGHSIIDSVSFAPVPPGAFDKAHAIKLSDSVDAYSNEDWVRFRKDSITEKEQTTYQFLDSFAKAVHMETFMQNVSRLAVSRLPVGKVDVDVDRLFVTNEYEGIRLGLGLFSNDKVSKYYSAGGWAGYGFDDRQWKYGGSVTLYANGKKENWLQLAYEKNVGKPGEVVLHEELQNNLSSWLLGRVDLFEQYTAMASMQLGYWQLRPTLKLGTATPLYQSNFSVNGKTILSFTNKEAAITFRYAYGEKRYPVFEYYESAGTKYPIAYLQLAKGNISAADYSSEYMRVVAAITFSHHTNRWGKDHIRVDGGIMHSANGQAIPQSYLMAGNGFKSNRFTFYKPDGFITMHPYDFFADQYTSVYYRHSFDRFLWNKRWSKPFMGIAHNMMWGSLNPINQTSNTNIRSLAQGYHESGLMLNHLLRINFSFADVYLNAGVFYHWNKEHHWNNNKTFVIGFGAGL